MTASSTLLLNARVWTPGATGVGDPRPVLLRDGRVAWVGEPGAAVTVPSDLRDDEGSEGRDLDTTRPGVRSLSSRTRAVPTVAVHDLDGRLLTPAFVDAHAHVTMTGQALAGVDLTSAGSVAEALRLVEVASLASPGGQVYCHSWDETRWPERRAFTAEELDRATDGGLVYAPRVDAHAAVVSTGLAARTRAHEREGWEGSGLVTREAHHVVRDGWAATVSPATRRHWIDLALRSAAEAGVGLVHECGGPHLSSRDDLGDVLHAGRSGTGPLVVGYWGELVDDAGRALELGQELGVRGLAGDLNADGSFGARTACLCEDYADAPGQRGYAYLDAEQIARHVAACTEAGLQAGFHVIGDGALATVIDGIEGAVARVGAAQVRNVGHRLEHVELCTPQQAERLARAGVSASMQPAFENAWGGGEGMYALRLGERAATSNAWRLLRDAGVPVAFGSDSPVTPFAPWEAVRAAVTPRHEGQRLTLGDALTCHTDAGWRIAGYRADDPSRGGRVEVGAPAHLVAWDCDGLPTLDGGAPAPTAQRTIVNGRTIFDREVPLP